MTDALVEIGSITLTSAVTEVVFSNLPQTYGDLFITCVWENSGSSSATRVQFNQDSSSAYKTVGIGGNGSTATYQVENSQSSMRAFGMSVGPSTARQSGNITVFDYSSTNKNKSSIIKYGGASTEVHTICGNWASNSPITSVRVFDVLGQTYSVGSTFTIYGVSI